MSINQRGRTVKKKTHMSSRGVSGSGKTKEVDGNHYLGEHLKMEGKYTTLTECKKTPLQLVLFTCELGLHPPSVHILDSDSGLSFGVKEIILMFLSSAVQIYILKGNSWPFFTPSSHCVNVSMNHFQKCMLLII